ncbi:MAG: hypothetical protein L0Y73_04530 [Candidatus Aminicenantes bacterium]|nr:hypothetical protein [Candidatus Aminicenantes bacterium]
MKKRFRFVMDFDVEIKEQFEKKDDDNIPKLRLLLRELLLDDQAILDFYKLWLLGDLQCDEHIEAIEQDIETRDEKDILRSLIEKLPLEEKKYYLEIIDSNNNRFDELETLFKQFSMLRFSKAIFQEI